MRPDVVSREGWPGQNRFKAHSAQRLDQSLMFAASLPSRTAIRCCQETRVIACTLIDESTAAQGQRREIADLAFALHFRLAKFNAETGGRGDRHTKSEFGCRVQADIEHITSALPRKRN